MHISYMYMIFFLCRYIWGLAPPPPYQKAGYATVASFRSPEEWPNEDGRFRPPPPPPPLATRNRRHCKQGSFLLLLMVWRSINDSTPTKH